MCKVVVVEVGTAMNRHQKNFPLVTAVVGMMMAATRESRAMCYTPTTLNTTNNIASNFEVRWV